MAASTFYSVDGSGNNLARVDMGKTDTALIRYARASYADGKSSPAGATRPSARVISNAVSDESEKSKNDRDLSEYLWIFGQFIDHDVDLTLTGTDAFNIAIPTGDAYFDPNSTGTKTMSLKRSLYDSSTGTTNPRQQLNAITAWIDGSMIYGSDTATANSLRSFVGGKLKTSDGNLLPIDPTTGFFMAGDIRANENVALISMQTVWMREHNRTADEVAAKNPTWTDEQIYQAARQWVIAELQAVTFNEFLPALLGPNAIPRYAGYRSNVDASIANEFSTAAFRFGHSTLGNDIDVFSNTGDELAEPIALRDALFNPTPVKTYGIDPFLKYGASSNSAEIDTKVIDDLRNFLFGAPGQGGLDLVSLNIQRGRDHGLADYNTARAAMGLPRVTSFGQITSDAALAGKLQSLYGSVDNVDLWVGVLAEDHVGGGSVGALGSRMIADQFRRLRDGDRLFYQNLFTGTALATLIATTLTGIVKDNTSLTNLQPNAFLFDVDLTGRAVVDGNRDGRIDPRDPALANATVDLLDASGAVVATTRSRLDGSWSFADVDELGTFTVRVSGSTATVRVVQGGTFGTTVLVAPARPTAPTPVGVETVQSPSRDELQPLFASTPVL
jgi:hypothetical protein